MTTKKLLGCTRRFIWNLWNDDVPGRFPLLRICPWVLSLSFLVGLPWIWNDPVAVSQVQIDGYTFADSVAIRIFMFFMMFRGLEAWLYDAKRWHRESEEDAESIDSQESVCGGGL
jgi:hypothetical protein